MRDFSGAATQTGKLTILSAGVRFPYQTERGKLGLGHLRELDETREWPRGSSLKEVNSISMVLFYRVELKCPTLPTVQSRSVA